MELEGNDTVLRMDVIFSTMKLSNIVHLDRYLFGLCSGEKIVASPFNKRRLIYLNNDGAIGEINSICL